MKALPDLPLNVDAGEELDLVVVSPLMVGVGGLVQAVAGGGVQDLPGVRHLPQLLGMVVTFLLAMVRSNCYLHGCITVVHHHISVISRY